MNSEYSFSLTSCLTKVEEPSLSYYLSIAGGRTIKFIPFPRVLVLCEMQSVSSKIWTRVVVSISYNDNHYTTGTSLPHYIYTWQGGWVNTHKYDIFVCIYPNPSPRIGFDTKSIFKRSIICSNSEFSFTYTCYITMADEQSWQEWEIDSCLP